MSAPAVLAQQLRHVYRRGDADVAALDGVDFVVAEGEAVGVLGPSGSGKSTLLMLLAGVEAVTEGRLEVLGHDVGAMDERARMRLRAESVGVLLQDPGRNLLVYGSVMDNLLFAMRPRVPRRSQRRERAHELLAAVGLPGYAARPIHTLSGGEQQRLAVAVAFAGRPRLVLADEPTSQLDEATGVVVLDLLLDLHRREKCAAVVVVTHDPAVGALLDRTISLADGRVVDGWRA